MQKNKRQAIVSKTEAIPTEKAVSTALTIVTPGEEPKAEETVAEVIEEPKTFTRNLEQTLKLVEDLHLKKRQRDNLEASLDKLESFEVEQKEEDLDNNFSGCQITLEDDDRNKWGTKNPVIIGECINFLKERFMLKLSEIEAKIVIP